MAAMNGTKRKRSVHFVVLECCIVVYFEAL